MKEDDFQSIAAVVHSLLDLVKDYSEKNTLLPNKTDSTLSQISGIYERISSMLLKAKVNEKKFHELITEHNELVVKKEQIKYGTLYDEIDRLSYLTEQNQQLSTQINHIEEENL